MQNLKQILFFVVVFSAAWSLSPSVSAQTPAIERIEVQSLSPGRPVRVLAFGSGLKDPLYLWTPYGNISHIPGDSKPDEKLAQFSGAFAKQVPSGICQTRVVTAHGVSTERLLVVDVLPAHSPGDSCEVNPPSAVLPLPCSVNGQINALKPKFFALDLFRDRPVSIEVFARRLNSPLDPVLRVLDAAGQELAFADDTPGLAGDAQLRLMVPKDGRYVLELRDVQYSGSAAHYFHLRVGGFPLVQGAYPRRSAAGGNVELVGDTMPGVKARVPDTGPASLAAVSVDTEQGSGFATVCRVEAVPLLETEPNDRREEATTVPKDSVAIAGRFQSQDDTDWFRIVITEPRHLCVTAHTRDVGSPSDVVLELWDADGNRILESDDAGRSDAQISKAVEHAGDYFIRVRELGGQGGTVWTYDLDIQLQGRVELATAVDTLPVPEAGTAVIPITVLRHGFTEAFELVAENLPNGVVSPPVVVTKKQKTAFVTIREIEASSGNWQQQMQLRGRRKSGQHLANVWFDPPAQNGSAYHLPKHVSGVFAFRAPAAPFSLTCDTEEFLLVPGTEKKLIVNAKRSEGWAQPIQITSAVPKAEMPPGITVTDVTMAKDTAELTVRVDQNAFAGRYSVSLQGTLKKDKTTIVQPVATITLTVGILD